ncbi:MAG: hypothetical protein LBV78_16785, partial [Kitasatospora sp.]|nr:hypothetical protein [Kitasatospora sp.]
MNDNDEPSDSAVLSAIRDSISGVSMPTAPHLEAITARGRARRRRRLGGLSVVGAGACAALAVGLVGGWGSAGPPPQHEVPPAHLAAFSVLAGPHGSTTLTLYPKQIIDPNAVRQALAEHGIPAVVTADKFCRTANQPAGVAGVVSLGPHRGPLQPGASRPQPVRPGFPRLHPLRPGFPPPHPARPALRPRLVIHGSAIPHGSKLSIGYRQNSQNREISFTLIQAGAPL